MGEPVRAMVGANGRIYLRPGPLGRRPGDRRRRAAPSPASGPTSSASPPTAATSACSTVRRDAVVDRRRRPGVRRGRRRRRHRHGRRRRRPGGPLRGRGAPGAGLRRRPSSSSRPRRATACRGTRARASAPQHDDQHFFARPDPGGGRALPALVRRGRLVVPADPYRSTQWGHLSPDGSVAVMPVDGGSQVFDVDSGRRLPVDLPGRRFILGGWTSADDGVRPRGRRAAPSDHTRCAW